MRLASLIVALLSGLAVTLLAVADASPDSTLDALHRAGADADTAAFESLLAADVVFLGVDGAARLEGDAARKFFSGHLAQDNVWAYRSSLRETRLSADGSVAWFDETLEHDRLGRGRGTGVLIRSADGWKVAQYNLTVPSPGGAVASTGSAGAQVIAPGGAATSPGETAAQPTAAEEKKRCRMTSFKTNTRAKC